MRLIIFCGESHEAWGPSSVKTGIGGSEEAVINITKEMAKLGHEVTVFNKCDKPGVYDKVTYKSFEDYEEDECDIMIVWRNSQHLFYLKNFKSAYYWLHDTMPEKDILVALQKAKKAMVLSKYHARLYPSVPQEMFMITRNGIDVSQFKKRLEKERGKIIYASSYDRGLKDLLEMWPNIKGNCPWATLHIYYGWQTWKKIAEQGGEEEVKAFKAVQEEFEELMNQEGITHHGRVGHEELAEAFLTSEVWAYPTWWPEISCITAMKAQAAGAIPVVIPTAAVAETVKFGARTDRGFYTNLNGNVILPKGTMEQFADKLIETLKLPEEKKNEMVEKMHQYAVENLGWDTLAKEWIKEFEESL